MARIKVRQNGPYLVEGDDVTVVDWNGNSYQIAKRPFALCRCGGSTTKPFCDGTHSRIGFAAAETAVAEGPAEGGARKKRPRRTGVAAPRLSEVVGLRGGVATGRRWLAT